MPPKNFQNPLFLDIETVSCARDYGALPKGMQALWNKKARYFGANSEAEQAELFSEKAGIFAEFGKIIVIALGYVEKTKDGPLIRTKGLADDDERTLLMHFIELLNQFPAKGLQLCGHNGKEFDFPYLCRRMVVHGIPLPEVLDLTGKKPWEVNHLDTMELWKFGDKKHFTSLDLLTQLFGMSSSKDLMDGSEVNQWYYEKKDLESIKKYCIKDVVATIQVYRRLTGQPLIPESLLSSEY